MGTLASKKNGYNVGSEHSNYSGELGGVEKGVVCHKTVSELEREKSPAIKEHSYNSKVYLFRF